MLVFVGMKARPWALVHARVVGGVLITQLKTFSKQQSQKHTVPQPHCGTETERNKERKAKKKKVEEKCF